MHSPGGPRGRLREIARRAMRERDFLPDFSQEVMAEVARLDGAPVDRSSPDSGLRDLTGRLWCSIDNDDTRDMDQLSVAEPGANGAIRVLVAVADVAAYVGDGSAVDDHARHNTTSVYTAGQMFPMLPERLSTDLTSLVEGEDRLAVVVQMDVAEDGSVASSDVFRARVRNHARLAYDAMAAWLDGEAPPPPAAAEVAGLLELLRLQDQAAARLRALRHERGALDLETLEARPVFDGDALEDLHVERKNRAKALIEDFMIAANGATAGFLDAKGFPSLRRVVRTPKRWPRIADLARELGERLPDEPDARALAAFLERRRAADPDGFPELSLSVVKLLGSGEYVLDPPGQDAPGHFGLAVRDYAHSTAPNRRYPDLVIQRLLQAALAGRPSPYSLDELDAIARRCTVKEDDAQKVERQVRKSAAALLLADRIGQHFDGVVTGASEKGTWVRLFRPPVEGRLEHGFEGLDVGDRVRVRLTGTNVERGFIDFARAERR